MPLVRNQLAPPRLLPRLLNPNCTLVWEILLEWGENELSGASLPGLPAPDCRGSNPGPRIILSRVCRLDHFLRIFGVGSINVQ